MTILIPSVTAKGGRPDGNRAANGSKFFTIELVII